MRVHLVILWRVVEVAEAEIAVGYLWQEGELKQIRWWENRN
jgi:hypothetical protein